MSRQRARHSTVDVLGKRADGQTRLLLGCARREHARARTGHPHPRRHAGQCGNRFGNRRVSSTWSRPQGHSGHNSRKRRLFSPTHSTVSIPAQRKSLRWRPPAAETPAPARSSASVTGFSTSPMPRAIAFSPPTKNGTSAPSGVASRRRRSRGKAQPPQAIECQQDAGRVRTAASQSGAKRYALVEGQPRRQAASRCPP